MKRMLFALLVVFTGALSASPVKQNVFINSGELLSKSKMGSAFEREVRVLREEAQQFALSKQSEIVGMEKALGEELQNGAYNDQNEVNKRVAEIEKKKRHAGFLIEERKRELTAQVEEREREIGQKIMEEVKNIAGERNWGSVIDARAAGCVFVAKDLDKTSDVLKDLNKKHDAEVALAALGGAKSTTA